MNTEQIRLLVADDHPVVRRGLVGELEAEGDIRIVGMASSVAEAITMAEETQPQIVLADMYLSDGTGVDICRRIRAQSIGERILIFTGFDTNSDLWDALDAQANGVISKSTDVCQVARAVRRAMAGEQLWTDDQLTRAQQWWDEAGCRLASLTRREREVLQLVAQGMSNKCIAATLGIGVTSTETHLSHLLQKLNLESRGELVAFAWRYRLVDSLQDRALA
jgi:two-component system, NarL family, response regulator DevR